MMHKPPEQTTAKILLENPPEGDISQWCQAETCYVLLRPGLQIEILNESGLALKRMVGDQENLEYILDDAIQHAAYEGDWAQLVLLRKCLLKFAQEAEDALRHIAEERPSKNAVHVKDAA